MDAEIGQPFTFPFTGRIIPRIGKGGLDIQVLANRLNELTIEGGEMGVM